MEEFKIPMMDIKLSHTCVHCAGKIEAEREGVRFSLKDILEKDLLKVPGRHLGQWVHAKNCFTEYFNKFKPN